MEGKLNTEAVLRVRAMEEMAQRDWAKERKQGRRLSWPGCRERSWGKRCHESQEHGAIHSGSVVKTT